MSRAFVKENDDGIDRDQPERPLSRHRNLVTESGLNAIDGAIRELEERVALARAADEAAEVASIQRDLRYWMARRASAECVPTSLHGTDRVRFGSWITISCDDGTTRVLRIVGEDEADPAKGLVSYVAPVAANMLGARIGDRVSAGNQDGEITEIR